MPLIPLTCPNCGGSVTVDSNKESAVCEFCGKPYIVKEAIVQNYINNEISIDTVNMIAEKDFVVKAGVLTEYKGESVDVTIPENAKSISQSAFAGSAIETITIPDGIKEIPQYAFRNCTALREVKLPDTLEVIESYAFKNCKSLKQITIPESVKTIKKLAFEGCDSLEVVIMPKDETHSLQLELGVFSDCRNIKEVYWENHSCEDVNLFFFAEDNHMIKNSWTPPQGICPYCGKELIQKTGGKWKCKNCGNTYMAE